MLLQCPSCSARYQVDAGTWPADEGPHGDLLLRPRKVRCRRCQEVWLATPEAEEEIFDPGPPLGEAVLRAAPVPAAFARTRNAEAPEAPEAPVEPAETGEARLAKRRRWPWLLAVLAGAAACYALVGANVVDPEDFGLPPLAPWAQPHFPSGFRADFATLQWPSVSLPAITVPQAPASRLTLAVAARKEGIPGGGSVWTISGTIANATKGTLGVPPIGLELLESNGAVLSSWSIRPPVASLQSGRQIAFATTALSPPDAAGRVRVTLKPASLARL